MTWNTPANEVRASLNKRILVDGFHLVLDLDKSHGSILVDAGTGKEYLDFFSMFASQPLGYRHPGMADPRFAERLAAVAATKPVNSDVYSRPYADFVTTFDRIVPPSFNHFFFIEGGALAVENALKVAFDWKSRKNEAHGRPAAGSRIAHLKGAFHGRTGYTLSLTNTDTLKTARFPQFPDWPRLPAPALTFPLTDEGLAATAAVEAEALATLQAAHEAAPHEIAAVLLEPIQGEGGDNHFRPEFLAALREWCDRNEALLILDEVQTGMGLTGEWWACQALGVLPDILCFGKKSQVCGIAATDRIDDVDNVFKVSSRINSTWGGNLTDMVRATRYIEIIEEQDILAHAKEAGARLLAGLESLADSGPVSNVRGRGLMCAFDLPSAAQRDTARSQLQEAGVLILACGPRSLRFRPVLDVPLEVVDEGLARIAKVVSAL